MCVVLGYSSSASNRGQADASKYFAGQLSAVHSEWIAAGYEKSLKATAQQHKQYIVFSSRGERRGICDAQRRTGRCQKLVRIRQAGTNTFAQRNGILGQNGTGSTYFEGNMK